MNIVRIESTKRIIYKIGCIHCYFNLKIHKKNNRKTKFIQFQY